MSITKFLHVSDLHNRYECLERLNCIASRYPEHVLLITGDLTDDGTVKQYQSVKAMLDEMSNQYIVVPGNHDYAGYGNFDRREKAERFDETFGTHFSRKEWVSYRLDLETETAIIGLNSNPGTFGYFLDFASGSIGESQRKFLNTHLNLIMPHVRIVLLHHHLRDPNIIGPWKRRWYWLTHRLVELRDSTALCKVLKGRVDLVLHGHRHGQYKYLVNGMLVHCAGAFYKQSRALEIIVEDGKLTTGYVRII